MVGNYNTNMELLNITNSFNIFGLEIKFYGVTMAIAYAVALIVAIVLCKKKKYDSNLPYKLLLLIFPLAVIGGRLGYVIFSERSWTFLEILDIRSGGLMLYGGIFLALIGVVIYAVIKKQNVLKYFDLIVPCMILAQAIGRWGNFFNQEAYGYVVNNPELQWFPFAVFIEAEGAWHLATFFYESIWCFASFFVLYFVHTKTNKLGLTTALYLILYGTERLFVEGLRTDSLYVGPIRVSQLISTIMILLGLLYVIYLIIIEFKKRKLAKVKFNETHIYEDTAKKLSNLEYTAPTKQYEAQPQQEPVKKTCGNKRVEKIIEQNRINKEQKQKKSKNKK